jgi:hypothetical protein
MEKFELYTLTVYNMLDPVDDENFWEAIIEVQDICSLYDLHLFIQHVVDFDNDHLFEFYAGRNYRNRKLEFSDNPGYPYAGGEYEDILLKDIYPLKGLKLFYLFDPGDNWLFEVCKSRKKAKIQQDIKYPRIVTDNGIKLRQYYHEDE